MPIVSTLVRHRFSFRARRFFAEPAVSQSGFNNEWPLVLGVLPHSNGFWAVSCQSFCSENSRGLTVRSPAALWPANMDQFWQARIRLGFLPQAAQQPDERRGCSADGPNRDVATAELCHKGTGIVLATNVGTAVTKGALASC
jgi:hypothetical protein